MITPNQERHLGQKAYLIMVSKRMLPGLGIMVVAALLLAASGAIAGVTAGLATAAGASQAQAVPAVSSYVVNVTLGLLIIGLVACLGGAIMARWEYSNYSYTFEEFDLKLKRGILFKHVDSLPYRQIQDVNIDRSLIYQAFGLSKLTILTAGHEEKGERGETEMILEPIGREDAEEIRQILERKIGVVITKTETEADLAAAGGEGAALKP